MKSYKGRIENIPYSEQKCSEDRSFLEGREQVEDEPHVGRASTSKMDDNMERVRSPVRSDRRLTLRMISELNFYREVLERLRKRVARVRPGTACTWMLCHDNAPCHIAVSINEFVAEKSIPVVPQPPYSPDLSTCDFFLFFRLKNHLKGRHLGTLDNIQNSVTDKLKGIPAEAFQHCY
jgi:hypothetical protein